MSSKKLISSGMVAHTLNLSIQEQRQGDLYKIEASMVYIVSSKPVKATY